MKFSYIRLILLCTLVLCAVSVSAQFTLPPKNAYVNKLPAVIHVGDEPLIKSGGSAIIGLRLNGGSQSDIDWVKSFIVGTQSPSLVTDSPLVVYRHSIPGIDPSWKVGVNDFSFDTNAPISVHGVFSTGDIVTTESLETRLLGLENVKKATGLLSQIRACTESATGSIVACESVSAPVITFAVTPKTILANNPSSVQINWSSSNASECHALSGSGFYTAKETSGTDTSNILKGGAGAKILFTIVCQNDMGVSAYKSIEVSVQ